MGVSARERVLVVRRHPRHVVLFAAVAGMLGGVWAPAALPVAGLLAAGLAARRGIAAAALLALLAGAAIADLRRDAVDGGVLPAALGSRVAVEAVVLEPLRVRASGERVARARIAGAVAGRGESLLLRLGAGVAGDPEPGQAVRVAGRLGRLRPFESLQRRRGALAAVDVHRLEPAGWRRGGVAGALDGVRRRAERALAAGVPPSRAAVLHGMVLGRDERIAPEAREAWQRSGLAHLLAASGSNVMLLATLVLAVGALAGAPLRARLAAAIALIAVYVPVAGAGPSIQRAGVMGAAGLVAAIAGRPSSRWYALGLAAAVTLALHPYAAAEPGWQLSFAAVAGLFAWASRIRRWLRRRAIPAAAAEVAALTVAATVATAPLMAVHFDEVSVVTLGANLAAAPAVAPVMWLGTLAAVAGQVGLPAAPLAWPAGLLAGYVGWVAEVAASVPWATVRVEAGPAAALCACAAAGWVAWRGRGAVAGAAAGAARRHPAVVAAVATSAGLVLLALLAGPGGMTPPVPGETVVSFLDVGQGDATLLQRDGASVLVDTGPPGGPVVDAVRRAGVRRLDALVVTHAQADHEGAALEVVERLRPRVVVNGGPGWPTEVQRALPAAAARAGSRLAVAAGGDAVRVGALELRILWPPPELLRAPPEGDPNDRALVAHVRSGRFDLLLPADAESHVTTPLELPRVEALKVAHHGSADELLPLLLERIRPAVAAIEVGRANRYGHPAPTTLAALRAVPHVHRTDRDGTVHLRVSPSGAMRIETEGALR